LQLRGSTSNVASTIGQARLACSTPICAARYGVLVIDEIEARVRKQSFNLDRPLTKASVFKKRLGAACRNAGGPILKSAQSALGGVEDRARRSSTMLPSSFNTQRFCREVAQQLFVVLSGPIAPTRVPLAAPETAKRGSAGFNNVMAAPGYPPAK